MKSNFSRIIQGCMNWGKWGSSLSQNEMEKLIHFNLEKGITSFDHADIYGDYTTEIEFGKAFKNSSIKREEVQLISKYPFGVFVWTKIAMKKFEKFCPEHFRAMGRLHIFILKFIDL